MVAVHFTTGYYHVNLTLLMQYSFFWLLLHIVFISYCRSTSASLAANTVTCITKQKWWWWWWWWWSRRKAVFFAIIVPVLKTLCMLDMKILELFCKFSCAMLMLKFLCAKSYVYNVPVTIFFPTEDLTEKVYCHFN